MPCQYIYIYKGDDTNWDNEQFLTINISPKEGSSIDLSDMKAKFILGAYSNEYSLATGSFTVDLTATVTDSYSFGPINGTVKIYDSLGRIKTVANTIPFYVTDKVVGEQSQSIDLPVPENLPIDINVTVGSQVSYNDLTDKPSINGVTIEGDKSGYDYGLADEAGLSLKVSKSGDTMTGDLVMSEGTEIAMSDGSLKSHDGMLGLEGENYWLRVDTTSGLGAAIKTVNGIGEVLTTLDVKSTYSASGMDPVNGIAVASAISGKQDTITGAATSITTSNLTANRAVISDNNGKVAVSSVTSTELGYVSGVTSAIQTQISNEVQARTNADNNLQGQIDGLAASSDVTDIVGTYAELQAYDTSKLKDNDIIKVLSDSTHDNASSYYRWSTSTETFTYVGSEGPYYTKSEADSEFLSQADASTTYLTQANAASTYATQSSLTSGLATKASSADGVTITDSGSAISTVAVKEQRANTAIKQWVGTKAQYEAITTKDANTVYVITDETDVEAITVDSALSTTSEHPVQNKVITNALQNIDALPSQTGQSGKFLTTNGTAASWATVDALPSQTGNSGKFLTTDGTSASWATVQSGGVSTITWYTGNTGATITISDTSTASLVRIYKNGLLLQPTEDYSISGTTLTLSTALVSTDKITLLLEYTSYASIQEPAAYIVSTWHSGTNWCRIWSDGWCEQGGFLSTPTASIDYDIGLHQAYADSNYTILLTNSSQRYSWVFSEDPSIKKTNQFKIYVHQYAEEGVHWETKGYIN